MFNMIDLVSVLKKAWLKTRLFCIRYNGSLAFVITRGRGDYFRCPISVSISPTNCIKNSQENKSGHDQPHTIIVHVLV